MIEIIPLDYDNVDIVKQLKLKDVYVASLPHVSKLLNSEFPIKNKVIAIKSVLAFVEYIDTRMSMEKVDEIEINQHIIISFFNRNSYKAFLELLSNLDIIKRVKGKNEHYYEIGKYSSSYTLTTSYKYSELCYAFFDKNKKKNVLNCAINIDKRFKNTIQKTEINVVSAIKAEISTFKDNKNKLRSRISRILNFTRNERYIKKGFNVDRIYHSISGISKISRPFLTIDGHQFFSIDIKNSQPMLLCYLLGKEKKEYDYIYKVICEKGLFYESFGTDREKIKVDLYKNVFFDWKPNSEINKQFKEMYPLTWKSLNEIYYDKKVPMARTLQNIEAEIVNSIEPKSRNYFTLFDAIYFTNFADKYFIEQEITNKFLKYGFKPSFS